MVVQLGPETVQESTFSIVCPGDISNQLSLGITDLLTEQPGIPLRSWSDKSIYPTQLPLPQAANTRKPSMHNCLTFSV